MSCSAHFSQSYAEARAKFLAAAAAAGLNITSHMHPLPGRHGEPLAMDVLFDGPKDAQRMLIISSGCHGVEGFGGSGVQLALLSDAAWRSAARQAGVAVLYIHAINPYGFSWWRRTTHENVDLNRNFHDFSKPLPANPGYDKLADLLIPSQWPPSLLNKLSLLSFVVRHGAKATQAAVSGGQYRHPRGLFYGGCGATWSHKTLREVLREHGRQRQKIGWIDVHTGLGPSGIGERILACRNEALQRATDWWGPNVTSAQDGSSTSAVLEGQMWSAIYDECQQAEYTGIALEYGTQPMRQVFEALRADQWLELHPEASDGKRHRIKRQIRDAFYTDTDVWKRQVVEQAKEAALQAIQGLASR
ncbi:M14 family metallopeptidase [Herbaspirillum sp. ST 5-3]|uniref:M14 family metallopeptidase n=1 Tax=Oxalobacteraceae TaxID=75682 RepID=UPI0010A44D0C|nr:M14 family metallopeptidase [Herbaspirillum sp. ST 5-3]